jgi:ProP effector
VSSAHARYAKIATDTITVLADLYPRCFSNYERRRKPLKIGIHTDLAGILTPHECATALRFYCGNPGYLWACKEGAARIDLNGTAVGYVAAEEAKCARERLAQQKARKQRQEEARAKAEADGKVKSAFDKLRQAALARKKAA